MRLTPDCYKFKEEFGKYLSQERKFLGLGSAGDLSYIVGMSKPSAGNWERGYVFPRSIIVLKKLNFLFNNTPDAINELFTRKGIAPTQKEWDTFRKQAEINKEHHLILTSTEREIKPPSYIYTDKREQECRKAFGLYLKEKRVLMGLSGASLSKALGKNSVAFYLWEIGYSFPSSVKDLILLDKLFGDTIKVMFGLCEKYGVKLLKLEKQEVLSKLEEVRKF